MKLSCLHNKPAPASTKSILCFSIYISFINCVSNWNLVKLFLLPLIFSLFFFLAQVQESKSSCQKPDCTAKRCRLKCHLSTASGDLSFPHLFIAIAEPRVFVKTSCFTNCTLIQSYRTIVHISTTAQVCFKRVLSSIT